MQHSFCWLVLATLLSSRTSSAAYTEELALHALSDGSVLAHFEFSTAIPWQAAHVGTFPAVLLDAVRRHRVQQLELSLTQGRWVWEQQREVAAGPLHAAAGPQPPGLQLKVSFEEGAAQATQAAHGALTQALGGLLCADVATVPRLAVMAAPTVGWFAQPQPVATAAAQPAAGAASHSDDSGSSSSSGTGGQVYAWLAQESLCTENVAAWRRLLPCRHHAGLAALLHPVQLAAAPYHSLGLHLWVTPAAFGTSSSKGSVELRQVLTVVLPRPALQQQVEGQEAGLLASLFGSGPPGTCLAAGSTTVYLAGTEGGSTAQSAEANRTRSQAGIPGACKRLAVPAGTLLACDVAPLAPPSSKPRPQLPLSLLLLNSSGSGSGCSSGNNSCSCGAGSSVSESLARQRAVPVPPRVVQHVVQGGSTWGTLVVGTCVWAGAAPAAAPSLLHLMQLVPWQLLVDSSSVQLRLNGEVLQQHSPELAWQRVDARPDRTAVVEALLRLPTAAPAPAAADPDAGGWLEVQLAVSYRTAFVPVSDHAPDASRGVELPPAIATLLPPACANPSSTTRGSGNSSSRGSGRNDGSGAECTAVAAPLLLRLQSSCGAWQQYSSSGGGTLVPLPLPDFSMTFNVVCFTSALLAVLLGGVANLVLRSPEEFADTHSTGGLSFWQKKKKRLLLFLPVLLVTLGLIVYLDKDMQRWVLSMLHVVLPHLRQGPEQHGEL